MEWRNKSEGNRQDRTEGRRRKDSRAVLSLLKNVSGNTDLLSGPAQPCRPSATPVLGHHPACLGHWLSSGETQAFLVNRSHQVLTLPS